MKTLVTPVYIHVYIAMILVLPACGPQMTDAGLSGASDSAAAPDSQPRPGYRDLNAESATSADAQSAAAGSQGDAPFVDTSDCPGVAPHEGLNACDDDDIDAGGIDASGGNDDAPDGDQPAQTAAPAATATPAPQATQPPTQPPKVVEFRITAGTATKPWNAQAQTVAAKIGQTVRIFNDDAVVHRLHTNGAPCPHGSNIAPGASFDCVVTKAFEPGAAPLYDHIAGPTAQFWIRATP